MSFARFIRASVVFTAPVIAIICTFWSGADASVPTHVMTADWVGFEKAPKYPPAQYAPYLSWDETSQQYARGFAAAGVKTMFYSNPNRQFQNGPLYSNDEATFAHDCKGSRIMSTQANTYLMNPDSKNLGLAWIKLAHSVESQAHYDAFFEDDANDVNYVTALPCWYQPPNWLAFSMKLTGWLKWKGYPVVYNGLAMFGPGLTISPTIALNAVTLGGMIEDCYIRPGTSNYQPASQVWKTVENTAIVMAQQKKLLYCYADNWQFSDDSATALTLRQYALASFLLTYDPGTSILWEAFPTRSGFRVNPETAVVPTQPVLPQPLTIDGLLTLTGVYGREYKACYVGGKLVGKCAAVVNPDPFHSYLFPFATYRHTLVLRGSGILDGGKIATNGAAPPATMAPLAAYVVFQ